MALEVDKPYTLGYHIVNRFPHDKRAFTQGLFIHNSTLFESTGMYGQSSIRKVDIKTGKVLQMSRYSDRIFAEGAAMHLPDKKIYGLSWQERVVFQINPESLVVDKQFDLPDAVKEGWGLTSDGKLLILSDGSSVLFFVDPSKGHLEVNRTLQIVDPFQKVEVPYINELEYVNGKIFANVYGLDHIGVIDPQSGRIEQWVDCRGLWPGGIRENNEVFNGIAFDAEHQNLYVTGKYWPTLYQIELTRNAPAEDSHHT
jgi:glutamine cyclotransferase